MLCACEGPGSKVPKHCEEPAEIAKLPGPVEELDEYFGEDFAQYHESSDMYHSMRKERADGHVHWNLQNRGFPSAIVQPKDAAGVQFAVRYAAAHLRGFPLCVSGGRHTHQSFKTGAFVIDMSKIKGVEVDKAGGTVTFGGGCVCKDLDQELQKHHAGVTVGNAYNVGAASLFMHGGHGCLQPKMGMSCDNVVQFKVVTMDGELRTVSETENKDLYWGMCGGGSTLGIVVQATVKIIPMRDDNCVMGWDEVHLPLGMMSCPDRPELIDRWIKFLGQDGTPSNAFGQMIVPGGGPVIEQVYFTHWEAKDYEEHVQGIYNKYRETRGWAMLQSGCKLFHYHNGVNANQDLANPYSGIAKTFELSSWPEGLSQVIADAMDSTKSPLCDNCLIIIYWPGKKDTPSKQMPQDKNAYWNRQVSNSLILIGGVDPKMTHDAAPEKFESLMAQKRDFIGQVEAKVRALGCVCGAYTVSDGVDPREVYGGNLPRLRELKQKFDPNAFLVNNFGPLDGKA